MPDLSAVQPPPERVLDAYLSPDIRRLIEERYYRKVQLQAELAVLRADPSFFESPSDHVALFADHGIAHVRDVALRSLDVLETVHGVLIPPRAPERLALMRAIGVLLAYVHDIGMSVPGAKARAMHPEYAAQAVLGPDFDDIVAELMADDRGRILRALPIGPTDATPEKVLREVLATAMAHSKSKVPAALLSQREALRQALIVAANTELDRLHAWQRAKRNGLAAEANPPWDQNVPLSGFDWLVAEHAADFAADVIDSLRVLRAADALRQRGTTLKTSANNEIFVDQRNATAVFALRLDNKRLFLLETADPTSAGEANLKSSELDSEGNLRISFHHGKFKDSETIAFAARSAAMIVSDIYADTLCSFVRPADGPDGLLALRQEKARIRIEQVDENTDFAALVVSELGRIDPLAASRVEVVPSLAACTPEERARYLAGEEVAWSHAERQALLGEVARFGHRSDGIDAALAFTHVRKVSLEADDVLVEAGAPSGFVYIPLQDGLSGQPLGGYAPFDVAAFTPVGVTGVVRGGTRNATIAASRPLALLAIPKDVYLAHWHRTYDAVSFAALFASDHAPSD